MLMGATCHKRVAVEDYPPGAMRVRYVAATDYSECLVASVVMCGNYVLNSNRMTPEQVERDLADAGLDHTRVGDMRTWLKTQGIQMTPLKGRYSSEPPNGLAWWVLDRGYPVICVVNRHAGDAEYNHAVLVIDVKINETSEAPEGVYVLDPASPKRIEHIERQMFEHYWGSAGSVMLPLFEAPHE
jgi:hypothetical protein